MTEPTTAAGRDMLNDLEVLWGKQAWASFPWGSTILAIEAEARQQDASALREALERIVGLYTDNRTRPASFAIQAGEVAIKALAALPPSAPPDEPPDTVFNAGFQAGVESVAVGPPSPPASDS